MSNGSGSAKDQRENEPRPAIAPVMSDLVGFNCDLMGFIGDLMGFHANGI
jgi:hypothetical protein